MDRETRRLVEELPPREAGPLENNLIDEFVGGEIDRRSSCARATMFGLSRRHDGQRCSRFAGEAGAAPRGAGRRRPRRAARSALGIAALRRLARAVPAQRGRLARVRRHPRRVPDLHEPEGTGRAGARDELEAERRRDRVDVPDPEGRQVPQRQDDDGEGRRREHEAVRPREGLERRPDRRSSTRPASRRPGTYTVVFRLKSPIGVFPYLVSQTTYQAIIQPAAIAAQPGTWVQGGMIGTGAVQAREATSTRRAPTLVRNAAYWGGRPPLDGVKITFYQGSAPLVLALRAGQIDLAMQLSPQEAQPFKNNSKYTYYALPTSAHRQVCMRTDQRPVQGRPRPAGARARDQPARSRSQKIMLGDGAGRQRQPVLEAASPSTDPSTKQRTQNLAAREGAAAGSGRREPEVQPHDVELPRPPRPRGVDPGVRARGRIDIGIEVMDGGEVLRLRAGGRRLRHDDPVAEPHLRP